MSFHQWINQPLNLMTSLVAVAQAVERMKPEALSTSLQENCAACAQWANSTFLREAPDLLPTSPFQPIVRHN